jgi:hypothetical protein
MSLRLLPRLGLAARPSVRAVAGVPAVRALSVSAVARAEPDGREPKDPQLGDYPDLPYQSLQRRRYDPSWWDPQEKRNFGETVSGAGGVQRRGRWSARRPRGPVTRYGHAAGLSCFQEDCAECERSTEVRCMRAATWVFSSVSAPPLASHLK